MHNNSRCTTDSFDYSDNRNSTATKAAMSRSLWMKIYEFKLSKKVLSKRRVIGIKKWKLHLQALINLPTLHSLNVVFVSNTLHLPLPPRSLCYPKINTTKRARKLTSPIETKCPPGPRAESGTTAVKPWCACLNPRENPCCSEGISLRSFSPLNGRDRKREWEREGGKRRRERAAGWPWTGSIPSEANSSLQTSAFD